MRFSVAVHAIGETGEEAFVGVISIDAGTAREARDRAIEALWDERLSCASCRARATVIYRSRGGGESAAVRAARSTRSYLEESRRYSDGHGRCSEEEWRWYRFWWTWTALRFSSPRQERAWRKLGPELFYRRIERVKEWRARLISGGTAHAA